MTKADPGATGPTYWPDGNMSLLPVGSGVYRFFAANGGVIGVAEGTLDRPFASSVRPSVAIQAPRISSST